MIKIIKMRRIALPHSIIVMQNLGQCFRVFEDKSVCCLYTKELIPSMQSAWNLPEMLCVPYYSREETEPAFHYVTTIKPCPLFSPVCEILHHKNKSGNDAAHTIFLNECLSIGYAVNTGGSSVTSNQNAFLNSWTGDLKQ